MVTVAKVSLVLGKLYRVDVDGQISAAIPRLTSACRFSLSEGVLVMEPPAPGDKVLCWFPSAALCNGYIVGVEEDEI